MGVLRLESHTISMKNMIERLLKRLIVDIFHLLNHQTQKVIGLMITNQIVIKKC